MKPHRLLCTLTVATTLAVVASHTAAADDAALRRCRQLPDAGARLACYDALPVVAESPAVPEVPVVPVAPPASAAAPTSRFGLEAPRAEPSAISSRIEGVFEGWGPRTRFKLANGQVWQVIDDSTGVYNLKDPQVTVRRGVFGSFLLEIEGANRTPRVRRVE